MNTTRTALPFAAEFGTTTTVPAYADALPHRAASEIKNKWGEIQEAVKAESGLAITNRGTVEYVIIPVAAYDAMVKDILGVTERKLRALDNLSQDLDAMVARMQDSRHEERIRAVLGAKGKVTNPADAGESF